MIGRGLVGLVLVILFVSSCQTTESTLGPPPPPEPLRTPLVLESLGRAIRVAQIESVQDLPLIQPQFPQTLYWTSTILDRLGLNSSDFGPAEIETLDELFFYSRPNWNIEGPFREFYFPTLGDSSSAADETRTLQIQQYFLPQGVGTLEPSPEGVLIFVFPNDQYRTFLLFPNSPPMPAEWWSALNTDVPLVQPTEAEQEFRTFLTSPTPRIQETYLDPRTGLLSQTLFQTSPDPTFNLDRLPPTERNVFSFLFIFY